MDDLTREAVLHRRHVMRTFRRYVGCSMGEYVRRRRIRRAQHLLAETAIPLAAVSADAGFYDQSHFARTFKRMIGLTSGEYRRLAVDGAAHSNVRVRNSGGRGSEIVLSPAPPPRW